MPPKKRDQVHRPNCSPPRVTLALEPNTGYAVQRVKRADDLQSIAFAMIGREPREHFIAFYLDTRNNVIAVHNVSIGTAEAVTVHPREVFCPAIHCCAAGVIVAHNHPSGDPSPSKEDRLITDRLRAAGELLGVPLLDHMVIGATSFYSFAEELILPNRSTA